MNSNYRLLDTGNEKRLEQIGSFRVVRNAKQAFWRPALSKQEWDSADAVFDGEKWEGSLPECRVHFDKKTFDISLMDGGQLGIFPEQSPNWEWLEKVTASKDHLIINGFAYTGASTIFASTTTNEVTHLDASKTSVKRAKINLGLSGKEENSVRFIVDDVITFLEKEVKRGRRYDGFIFDPPAFGRGAKNKIWKIDRDIPVLIELINQLSDGRPAFILLSAHEPSMDENYLADLIKKLCPANTQIEKGSLIMNCESGRNIENGYFARFAVS
ncbi:MAG: hypothetical protein C0602_02450 [Denitrovibrio sp.]|nr:MAG: hypothetical protein C0602_02450 [Denitrovibrio sp.]